MIATDKILSEEGFELNVGNVLRGSPEYKLKGMARLRESHRQLTALCREYHRMIEEFNAIQPKAFNDAGRRVLAAFPESLKEKTA